MITVRVLVELEKGGREKGGQRAAFFALRM